ncbi:MAG TPA: hypothetical protein DET40_08215 [Lentisphaeria bacterium]|nr:MAG: hypothetical protein A2X45_10425 [Lentisphaerae bacterium GWF2_50_93]HCE43517.1 hypothetical protein [Lentisphaeria bacterium]
MATGDLYRTLNRYQLVGKVRQAIIAVLAVLSADLLLLFCLFSLDNMLNFNSWTRMFFVAVIVLFNLALMCWLLWIFSFRREGARRLATGFEKEHGIKDNSIINAVCFNEDDGIPPSLKNIFVGKASEKCRKVKLRFSSVAKTRNFILASRLLLLAILVFGIYSAVFHRHAQNALLRFINPCSQLASLNYTQFNVTPGDIEIIEGDSCRIVSTASRGGEPARDLSVVVKNQDSVDSYEMQRGDNGFSMDLKNITSPVVYSVRNRHESSRWFTVGVVRKPRFENLSVMVKPPEYSGEKEYPLPQLKRNNEILKDSLVKVSSVLPSGLKASFFANGRPLSDSSGFEHRLSAHTVFSANIKNERGLENKDAWTAEFSVVEDKVPEIRFLNTSTNIELLPGEKIPIQILAEDDIAVKTIDIFIEASPEEKILKSFKYDQNRKSLREVWMLTADKAVFATNATYRIWARVSDNFPGGHVGITQVPITVHIVDNSKILAEISKNDAEGKLYSFLIKALEKQKAVQNMLGGRIKNIKIKNELSEIDSNQNEVHKLIESASSTAGELRKSNRITEAMKTGIDQVKNGISTEILGEFKDAFNEKKGDARITLNKIILMQGQLIAKLEELLNLMALGKKDMEAKKEESKEELQDLALLDKLKGLKKDLDKFKEDQRKIMEKTEELDKKNPEDWTKNDEAVLGDLSAKEIDLSKFIKADFNDLSKLGRQDFSNSKMAEELIAMYEELQKAGDALKKKENIEIATLNEEAAAGLAETVEQNLERWLADTPDNIKWNAEQGEGSPDVNMTDLPNELTDIIGDLIESEKDMSEDSQDSTNSTAWDKDEGLGWGVSDGNINSMQAKGITGNVLPNNNEVQGRSGEGRSGKSSGQFVGNTAVGKGGRDTPTRLTESPFEEGTIKDTSKTAQGGATGGGKQSGIGHEGLRGKTPDNNRDLEQRFPGQVEMKQKAEALLRKLTVQNLPTGDLEEAISKMELMSKYNAKGKGLEFRQVRDDLLSSLIDAKTAVNEAVKSDVEKNIAKKKKDNFFKYNGKENTPSGYEDTVEAYFKSLAEGE